MYAKINRLVFPMAGINNPCLVVYRVHRRASFALSASARCACLSKMYSWTYNPIEGTNPGVPNGQRQSTGEVSDHKDKGELCTKLKFANSAGVVSLLACARQ